MCQADASGITQSLTGQALENDSDEIDTHVAHLVSDIKGRTSHKRNEEITLIQVRWEPPESTDSESGCEQDTA